jgi:hypothetical protein
LHNFLPMKTRLKLTYVTMQCFALLRNDLLIIDFVQCTVRACVSMHALSNAEKKERHLLCRSDRLVVHELPETETVPALLRAHVCVCVRVRKKRERAFLLIRVQLKLVSPSPRSPLASVLYLFSFSFRVFFLSFLSYSSPPSSFFDSQAIHIDLLGVPSKMKPYIFQPYRTYSPFPFFPISTLQI